MHLKELLKTKGLKQKWLAEQLGVSEVTVSNWCSGKSVPSLRNLKKLSEILDVPIDLISISGINERIGNQPTSNKENK